MRIKTSIRAKLTLLLISIMTIACVGGVVLVSLIAPYIYDLPGINVEIKGTLMLLLCGLLCTVIGSLLVAFASKHIVEPIKRLSVATKVIASGDFDVVLSTKVTDEIGELSKNFNLMAQELKSMEYLRKDFMSNVSHEFKTPISSIQGFAEMLKDPQVTKEEAEDYLNIIIEESTRLNRLSENILRLSRLDHQALPIKCQPIRLDEQLRKTILLLQEQWEGKSLAFELNLPEVTMMGDGALLQQVWINLIGNAIKFSHIGGKITLSIQRCQLNHGVQAYEVTVCDEGEGIPVYAQSQIYDKFYKADPSRTEAGNGLGLAIVKRILELCHGEITFDSEVGRGTWFKVRLPIEGDGN